MQETQSQLQETVIQLSQKQLIEQRQGSLNHTIDIMLNKASHLASGLVQNVLRETDYTFSQLMVIDRILKNHLIAFNGPIPKEKRMFRTIFTNMIDDITKEYGITIEDRNILTLIRKYLNVGPNYGWSSSGLNQHVTGYMIK